MPRFSANISMLFTEVDMLDRPRVAADVGFMGIEVQFPYDHTPADWATAIAEAGVQLALFNFPVGDMLDGGPGLAAMPGREAAFDAAVASALPYVEALQPGHVNVLPGSPPPELDRDACMAVLARNLHHAAEQLAPLGVGVVVEPVNTVDRPGFFLDRSDRAIEAIDLAAHENLGIQYDIYHMAIMEGDLAATMERLLPRIGHIQFADHPGRHEPGTGGLNFPALFAALDAMGYAGWVGAEYLPTRKTEETLEWLG
jgi:hydroxypyruvate isomerase